MKIRSKIILSLLLVSALSILFVGCLGLPDDSPGYTPGSITGRIMIPNQCASCIDNGPCLPKSNGTIPSHWVPAEEAIVTVIPHAALTDEDGYYTLNNVEPGVYYVITATIDNLVLKDVVLPDGVEAGKTYDAGTADCYSTALGLVVEYLMDSELTTEEIGVALDMYMQDTAFDELVETVCCIIEDCGNVSSYCCLVDCDPPGFTCDATSISLNIPDPDCDELCTTISKPLTVRFEGKDDVVINDFNDPRLDWDIPGAIDFTESTGELCLDGSLGTYNIRVTYVDPIPDSCGSVSRTVPVTFSACSCPPPTDVDSGGPYSETVICPDNEVTVNFVGSATGSGALTYDWDFGDGTILTDAGPSPSHTYQYPFTGSPYTVTLTVTDECGSDVDTTTVEVEYVPCNCGECESYSENDCFSVESWTSYDGGKNQTTFHIEICDIDDGSSCSGLSHWVLETDASCISSSDIVSATPAYTSIGSDGSTGRYGIKWENGLPGTGECKEFKIVLEGCRVDELNKYEAILKYGTTVSIFDVCGPTCN